MDKRSSIVIHVCPSLRNQVLYGVFLQTGFKKLGYNVSCTDDPHAKGDVHVCIGPHFAFNQCLGKPTIYIDRCLWGDDLEFVTIGWLDSDGGMIYPRSAPSDRPKPELKPWRNTQTQKAIFLFDYGPYPDKEYKAVSKHYSVTARVHPATKKPQPPLMEHLEGHDVVFGFRTSGLATAVIEGFPVVSFDSRAPVYSVAGHDILDIVRPDREQWLNNMSYAQWSGAEIKTGAALEYVLDSYETNTRAS